MISGSLDQKITIESENQVADGLGGFDKTWYEVGDIWAHMAPRNRNAEDVIDQQQRGVVMYRVTVRNLGVGKNLTESDRIVWDGKVLNIRSAPNAGRDHYRVLMAEVEANT